MSNLKSKISLGLRSVSKEWKKRKFQEERLSRQSLSYFRSRARISIKDAAFKVMEEAINKASSNGQYLANARQVMYAARPLVLEVTGGRCWRSSDYFTQTILKDYLEAHPEKMSKIVWDSRGNITEPHTAERIPLGGAEVSKYINGWKSEFATFERSALEKRIDTKGPVNRYVAALFIEKEGFDEILGDAGVAEKYDLALMSTKGIPVKALCDLNLKLVAEGVRVLVLHDFDLAGFKITKTLREGTRMSSGTAVIDLGLRLEDTKGLQSEAVPYQQEKDPKIYLWECGATQAECDFLVDSGDWRGWAGKRVELNAMTSEELIGFIERKLQGHNVTKVIPDEKTLKAAYKRAVFRQKIEETVVEMEEEIEGEEIKIPKGLYKKVAERLKDSKEPWDDIIWSLAEENI